MRDAGERLDQGGLGIPTDFINVWAAGRLVLDPLSATIFSSDPETYAAIQALEARGMPLADAIRKVAGLPWGDR